ncbi:hypothetical protein N478_16900 [Pseudoalteromonas luteoviolacea S4060-1]|uniref:Uncharacterized protein n=1 Tax=Pseudoalteromonas luteoviolacea S4060-1 TaxID=1365257 RepID=A0A167NC69_9GAMM|nr:hypothetical protein N478_16900 [Pseudoalteromonas luteoviolacea S4060-1]
MYDIYTVVDHLHPFVIAYGLILSWKVATARWFLISYLIVATFNLGMYPYAMQWSTHFYIFEVFLAIVFLVPIIYRRNLALLIYRKSGIDFYRQIYEKQTLSAQECMIILIVTLSMIINLITWFEVLAYKYYWLDNAYFKLYIRDNIQLLVQIILCGCFLTYAIKAESKELNYENTE